jgi:CTP synthase (UTP-ammonia lyase)
VVLHHVRGFPAQPTPLELRDWAMRIGVVGDYSEANHNHVATTEALAHAAEVLEEGVDVSWVATTDIGVGSATDSALSGFAGLLIAPGSPYASMEGALAAITFARSHDTPLLGTCGGFQHILIEYARNVAGIPDAQHAEYDPYASGLFVTPLSCSIAGTQMEVRLRPGSEAASAYGSTDAVERYYCNFGLNPDYRSVLEDAGLRVSGEDENGEVRVMEIPSLRFFLGTLFVPQASSLPGLPHPLIVELVKAATRSLVEGETKR